MTDPTREEIDRAVEKLIKHMPHGCIGELWTNEETARFIAEDAGVAWAPDETNSQKIGKTMIHVV